MQFKVDMRKGGGREKRQFCQFLYGRVCMASLSKIWIIYHMAFRHKRWFPYAKYGFHMPHGHHMLNMPSLYEICLPYITNPAVAK